MIAVTDRIRQSLVSLHMARALETLDQTLSRLEKGEISAIEAIDELRGKNLNLGSLVINRVSEPHLPAEVIDEIAEGRVDAGRVEDGLTAAGLKLADGDLAGLLTETIEHATRLQAQQIAKAQLDEVEMPTLELPSLGDGVDLGSIYELANLLQKAGA